VQASKLIIDHMAKEPFSIAWWPVAAMLLLLANSRTQYLDSAVATYSFAVLMLAGYLHYVTHIINEICAFLGINCLTIKPPRD